MNYEILVHSSIWAKDDDRGRWMANRKSRPETLPQNFNLKTNITKSFKLRRWIPINKEQTTKKNWKWDFCFRFHPILWLLLAGAATITNRYSLCLTQPPTQPRRRLSSRTSIRLKLKAGGRTSSQIFDCLSNISGKSGSSEGGSGNKRESCKDGIPAISYYIIIIFSGYIDPFLPRIRFPLWTQGRKE